MGEKRGVRALQAWCKKVTEGYKNVSVTDMSCSWRDGLAFCALIHHFRPDLIDFESLTKDNILLNNRLAFTVAEQSLGIPALLDAEDMVKYAQPDKLSIATYVSQYYQFFEGRNRGTTSNKLSLKRPLAERPFTQQPVPAKVAPKTSLVRGDKCHVCSNRVYILERLMVDTRLYHRTCFACSKCNAILKPGAYAASDEPGNYECIECPIPDSTVEETAPVQETKATCQELTSPEPEPLDLKLSTSFLPARTKFFQESLDTQEKKVESVENGDLEKNQGTLDEVPVKQPRKLKRLSVDITNTESSQSTAPISPDPSKTGSVSPLSPDLSKTRSVSPLSLPIITSPSLPPLKKINLAELSKPPIPTLKPILPSTPISKLSRLTTPPAESSTSTAESSKPKLSLRKLSADVTIREPTSLISSQEHSSLVSDSTAIPCKPLRSSLSLNKLNYNKPSDDFGGSSLNKLSPLSQTEPRSLITNSTATKSTSLEPLKISNTANKSSNSSLEPLKISKLYSSATQLSINSTKNHDLEPEQIRIKEGTPGMSRVKSAALVFESHASGYQSPLSSTSPWRQSRASENLSFTSRASMDIRKAVFDDKAKETKSVSEPEIEKASSSSSEDKKTEAPASQSSEKEEAKVTFSLGEEVPASPNVESNETTVLSSSLDNKTAVSSPSLDDDGKETVQSSSPSESKKSEVSPAPTKDENPFEAESETPVNSPTEAPAVLLPNAVECPSLDKSENKTDPKVYPDSLNPFGEEEEYPDDLNPFGDDGGDANSLRESSLCSSSVSVISRQYDEHLNPFGDDDDEDLSISSQPPRRSLDGGSLPSTPSMRSNSSRTLGGGYKKKPAPLPPSLRRSHQGHSSNPNLLIVSNQSTNVSPKPNKKPAPKPPGPPPPPPAPRSSTPIDPPVEKQQQDSAYSSETSQLDNLLNAKAVKEKNNLDVKQSDNNAPPNTFGYWKKKKRPAPSVPLPPRRQIKMMPVKEIQAELIEIEEKQIDLEQQGRDLETAIRETDELEPTADEEELILQLFELVNQKNALFRRQAELMYIKRSQSLEQEQADIEYQYRLLMGKPEKLKSEMEKQKEEELLQRLLEVVELRNEIVESMDMDRQRVQDEDLSIQEQLAQRQGQLQEKVAEPSPKQLEEETKKKKNKLKFKVKSREPSKDREDGQEDKSGKWKFHKKEKKKKT